MALVIIALWLGFLWLLVRFGILKKWTLWMKLSPIAVWAIVMVLVMLPSSSKVLAAGRRKTSVLFLAESTPGPFHTAAVSDSNRSMETSQSSLLKASRVAPLLGPLTAGFIAQQIRIDRAGHGLLGHDPVEAGVAGDAGANFLRLSFGHFVREIRIRDQSSAQCQ